MFFDILKKLGRWRLLRNEKTNCGLRYIYYWYEKKERLEAYLGSCVGVTLVDRRADVGGLLHLL